MTAHDDPPVLLEPYECSIEFQPGWIDLTLREGTKTEARARATEIVRRLDPHAPDIQSASVIDDMVERALSLDEDAPTLAAAYYSDTGKALATLVVDGYGDEGVARPGVDEVIPALLQWENADVTGNPEITHLELPAGPAVRVQSSLRVKRMFGFGRKLTEFIKYAVFPPALQTLVVVTVEWEETSRSERIAELADEAVRALRITPLVGDGGSTAAPGRTE
ncbi:hypothetical protein [Streptomyces sp. Tue6028]|uniref:hypothetical protein n=1 Tax=Streptomyces sp. Tue6028 TaxID=2036037 RepID=UPI003D733807